MLNLKSKQILIVSTSTDIGKTYFNCQLIKYLKDQGEEVNAIKPIISGFNISDEDCDTIKILRNLRLDINQDNLDKISPFRLREPLSPITAAKNEGIKIEYEEVLKFCQKNIEEARASNTYLTIESAGGLMTPICLGKTFLDLAEDLNVHVILVGACYLGGISATLSAYNNLKSKKIATTILINNHLDYDQKYLKIDDFTDELKSFVDCDVFLVENCFK